MLLEREIQAHVLMMRALFSLMATPLSSSCEAGGGGRRLAPPAPRRDGCTWKAAVISMTVHIREENHKQDADTVYN